MSQRLRTSSGILSGPTALSCVSFDFGIIYSFSSNLAFL